MKSNSGDLAWYFIFLNSLAAIGILVFGGNQALAQVTPDNTLGNENSVVNPRDATSDSIEGGATRGQNLFHSFQEFNVDADRGVYFANPEAVTNIFSRVTGNDVSDILGTLGVDGAANLFLINPNGIIFGEGASLDVQGSFAATTADGIEFGEQGFFSTSNPESSNLLTINPSAYLFNQVAPGAIVNNSTANNNIGLQVQPGKNLSLIGGDITLDRGLITAPGANVELGGLSESGSVNIQENGSLSFPDGVARSDVFLSNGTSVNVSGNEGGSIFVNANNLELSDTSSLVGGIASGLGTSNAQAGDIILDTTGNIDLRETSKVLNRVNENAIGNGGKIDIQTNSLTLGDRSWIDASTFGQGDAGKVTINANGTILADGESSDGFVSGVFSQVAKTGKGNSGGIEITTSNLTLTNGGEISANTIGQGNAGKIMITAEGTILADGEDSNGFNSGVFSTVEEETAAGNSGGIEITTSNLTLTNGGIINASTSGQGDAGKITINAESTISADGEDSNRFDSGVFSQVEEETAAGNSGGIEITTSNLTLTNGGIISASTAGQGDAGKIMINAEGTILADGEDSNGFNSGVFSTVEETATGNSGGIEITTSDLTLTNGGEINAGTAGQGNAGKIVINAEGTILDDGENSNGFNSGVFSIVEETAAGNSGGIEITTSDFTLTNGGIISASTVGQGDAGKIMINAEGIILADGEDSNGFNSGVFSTVEETAVGNSGGIEITTSNLTLTNGGIISASTGGQGDAGKITINAESTISADGESSDGFVSGVFSQVEETGKGNSGGIEITTSDFTLTNGGIISTSTVGKGDAGQLAANAKTLQLDNDAVITTFSDSTFEAGDLTLNIANSLQSTNGNISTNSLQSTGGNITITAGEIQLRGNGDIFTSVFEGVGAGGNINITADSVIAFDDVDIFTFAADGQGGNITLNTPAYFAENFTFNSLTSNPDSLDNNARADLNATGAVSGAVTIPNISFIQNSLNDLPNNSINTDELVANSCVSPVGNRQQGKFIITGTGGLPARPGNGSMSEFATGKVQSVPQDNKSSWQRGEPIIEPQGAYRLANGKLVLSRECSR